MIGLQTWSIVICRIYLKIYKNKILRLVVRSVELRIIFYIVIYQDLHTWKIQLYYLDAADLKR